MGKDIAGSEETGIANSKKMLFLGIFALGISLVLLGILLGSISGVIHDPGRGSDDYGGYETATRWLNFFARLSLNSGLVFVSVASFLTAVIGRGMHPTVRAGLGVAGGLIIGLNTVYVL